MLGFGAPGIGRSAHVAAFHPTLAQPEPACVESEQLPARGGLTADPVISLRAALTGLLDRQGVRSELVSQLLPRLSRVLDLDRPGANEEVRLLSDRSGRLQRLEVHPAAPGEAGAVYVVSCDTAGVQAWRENEPLRRVYRKYEGDLSGSLSASLTRGGIQPAQISEFCQIFGDEVELDPAIRPGDRWTMLTEEFVDSDGHLVRPGRVLGGRYAGGGRSHEAFYFDPEKLSGEAAAGEALSGESGAGDPLDRAAIDPVTGQLAVPSAFRMFLDEVLARDPILPHGEEPAFDGSTFGEAGGELLQIAASPALMTASAADEVTEGEGAPGPLTDELTTVSGDAQEAVPGASSTGDGGYYAADGRSLKRTFLRAPLVYKRISSVFTTARLHPMFHVVRPHLGVDFAAAYGTPVKAVADGIVLSAGWSRGYGQLLRIRHRDEIITYSAHLSRFGTGIRVGSAVRQGQVVGYVGTSGNATGPHLDFRVEKSGRFVDPLQFRPGGGEPLAATDRAHFDREVRAYRSALNALTTGESMPSERFAVLLTAELAGGEPDLR